MPTEQSSAVNDKPSEKPDPGKPVYELAMEIARLDPGSVAALRRGPLTGNGAAAFWKLLGKHKDEVLSDNFEQKWAAIIQSIAILTPKGSASPKESVHQSKHSMGAALWEAGISEKRLARLLNTPEKMRGDAAIRLCRRLAATGNYRFDILTLAYFILYTNNKTSRRIAQEYYRTEAKASRTARAE